MPKEHSKGSEIRATARDLIQQLHRIEKLGDELANHDDPNATLVEAQALVSLDAIRNSLSKKVSLPLADVLAGLRE